MKFIFRKELSQTLSSLIIAVIQRYTVTNIANYFKTEYIFCFSSIAGRDKSNILREIYCNL